MKMTPDEALSQFLVTDLRQISASHTINHKVTNVHDKDSWWNLNSFLKYSFALDISKSYTKYKKRYYIIHKKYPRF